MSTRPQLDYAAVLAMFEAGQIDSIEDALHRGQLDDLREVAARLPTPVVDERGGAT